jgi:hypothetical protein
MAGCRRLLFLSAGVDGRGDGLSSPLPSLPLHNMTRQLSHFSVFSSFGDALSGVSLSLLWAGKTPLLQHPHSGQM